MGLYLYCIRKKTNSKFSVKGIDGGKILVLPYQDLEAVVSWVSLEKFGSVEIQKKAQEDLKWIKEKAQLHEKVVEQAMKKGDKILSVIPMKFGTIFKTKEKLKETLEKYYSKFQRTLENLAEKQEWAIKVYLNRKIFEKEIKKISPTVQEKEKEIASMPEGMAYFMQKQIDDVVSKEAGGVLENYIENIFENLKKHAAAGTKGKILEKEVTNKPLPMVLNAIFLVPEDKLENFKNEIDKLNQKYKSMGFNFEYSGPWPPYNFI